MRSTTIATLVLPERQARQVADVLAEGAELGAEAVDLHEESPGTWRITAYFAQSDAAARSAVSAIVARVTGNAEAAEWQTLADEDWVRRSQQALPAVRVGNVLVHGRHARGAVRANDAAILIEAGLAFGTGHHATTRACLIAIQEVAKSRPIRSALDVGTGSGVLAIAIAQRGATVLATDIDPVALRIARDNVRLNRVSARVLVRPMPRASLLPGRQGARGYDLVVANILLEPLLKLAPAIARQTAPNGSVILSGLLPDQRRPIVTAYRAAGLGLRRWFIHDGWLAVVFHRPTKPSSAPPAAPRRPGRASAPSPRRFR
jgi:ribosomal protein L11 methyltransferase